MHVPACAADQDGLFTRAQARAAGVAHSTIRRRLAGGVWREVRPSVFTAETAPSSQGVRRRLRALWLQSGIPLSHWSALLWHGLDHDADVLRRAQRDPRRTPLHVTTSEPSHRAPADVTEHRIHLPRRDVIAADGVQVTSVPRTCIDLLMWLPRASARGLAYRAHQEGWVTAAEVRAAGRSRSCCAGVVQLRELAPIFDTPVHSVAEAEFVTVMSGAPGIRPRTNVPVAVAGGQRFVLDAVVEGLRLGIEIDGRRHHSDEARFVADRRRQNVLVADGWTILRFTWDDLVKRPDDVRAVVVDTAARIAVAS